MSYFQQNFQGLDLKRGSQAEESNIGAGIHGVGPKHMQSLSK